MNKSFKILNDFVSLFFPSICASCKNHLLQAEGPICTACRMDMPYSFTDDPEDEEISMRLEGVIRGSKCFSFLQFRADGRTRRILHAIKYQNKPNLGYELGKWFGEAIKRAHPLYSPDAVVPVPLHGRKLKKRGFNQSEMIAKGIAERLDTKMNIELLKREVETSTQTKKTKLERIENVEGIFKVINKKSVTPGRVLLVDDVVTTGSTLYSAAHSLYNAGINSVDFAVLARA